MATEVNREAEYQALRATIRERGTARLLVVPFTFAVWAATTIAAAAVITAASAKRASSRRWMRSPRSGGGSGGRMQIMEAVS